MSCITMLRSGGPLFPLRPGSLSPKLPEMDLAPGHFRQSYPKWTSPRVTFAKAVRNEPRPGSLSPKLPEMDLAPSHFRQSCPKWTSPRVAFAKVARNGPRPGSLSPKLPEMDLAPGHFRQSYPKWTSPRSGGESRKIRERGRVRPPPPRFRLRSDVVVE